MPEVKVIKQDEAQKVDLPGDSWSLLMVTDEIAGAAKSMLGISTFKPDVCTDQLIHEEEEMAYILQGSGCLKLENEIVQYKSGEALYIPAGVAHAVHNTGKEDLVMVFVFSYPKYPPTKKVI